MLIKKETNVVVNIKLNNNDKKAFINYNNTVSDHCTLELTEGVYFLFCQSVNGLIRFNGQFLFIGEIENAIRQEQCNYNDIVIKYCCNYSKNIGTVSSKNCLIQPIFNNNNNNNKIGYNYVNDTLYCYNIA